MGLNLNNISKVYGSGENATYALRNITLNIEDGEMVAITGPSGSGKSTMLNILGLIDKPTEGNYKINTLETKSLKGKDLAAKRNSNIGFVFQYFALMKEYSALDNVMLPLIYRRMPHSSRKKLALEYMKQMGIEDQAHKKISQLSGGQQQRVAIARALVGQPDVILADEPTGALDQKTGKDVIGILKEINKSGKTVIIVTHDPLIAASCNRVINIVDGEIIV